MLNIEGIVEAMQTPAVSGTLFYSVDRTQGIWRNAARRYKPSARNSSLAQQFVGDNLRREAGGICQPSRPYCVANDDFERRDGS